MANNLGIRQEAVLSRADGIGNEVPVCQEMIAIIDDLDSRLTEELDNVERLTQMLREAEATIENLKTQINS